MATTTPPPPRACDVGARDLTLLAAALAAALEGALHAAHRLQRALGSSPGGRAERAAWPAYPVMSAPATIPDTDAVSEPDPTHEAQGRRVGLSRREAEVLGLLAAGRSNRQIAAQLYLSPRTVQRHVANAYLKIGAHCRAEATAFAIDHGLR